MILLSQGGLIAIIICSAIAVEAIFTLLLFFVFLPLSFKKQIKDIEKKYSYLDAKLIGQDSQYFHRLEIISRTNLLYADKYETYSKRFKNIFDNEDKYCESILKQLNSLTKAKQFKQIKPVIAEARKAVNVFEESVNSFDSDIYQIIRLEEDCRRSIDSSKESFRRIKQTYYAEAESMAIASATFAKYFSKIEDTFASLDEQLESALYDEINEKLPELNNVISALAKVLTSLPKLSILVTKEMPEIISNAKKTYRNTEKEGLPLSHIGFEAHVNRWEKKNRELSKRIINLQTHRIEEECNLIKMEIEAVNNQLNSELECRKYFNEKYSEVYNNVNEIEKVFLKLTVNLPQVESIYKIPNQQQKIDELSAQVGQLTNSKRFLEGFVYSGIKQPFSVLKEHLDELDNNYQNVCKGVIEYKNYLDSLKSIAEDAYKSIFVYFERLKVAESTLREINISNLSSSYEDKFVAIYDTLNDINKQLRTRPIDVYYVEENINNLKRIADAIFEGIADYSRKSALDEKLFMKLNERRIDLDTAQRLDTLERAFFNGDFNNVTAQLKSMEESPLI